ncbi:MAG: hypothetical protein LLG37_01965 [Spirochaetia bacterium]|nr:hypothetical protein [Spirochaetia bacterium]
MKFVTVRDLVSNQKKTRQLIGREGSVLTYNGKPIALTIPVNEGNFEYMLNEAALLGFKSASESMQKAAEKKGLKPADAADEVKKYRAEKKKRR